MVNADTAPQHGNQFKPITNLCAQEVLHQPDVVRHILERGVAWFRVEDGLVRDFLDFFDTEIVAAFFPSGQPATDFLRANALVDRLRSFAPAEAVARLDALRTGAEGGAV